MDVGNAYIDLQHASRNSGRGACVKNLGGMTGEADVNRHGGVRLYRRCNLSVGNDRIQSGTERSTKTPPEEGGRVDPL